MKVTLKINVPNIADIRKEKEKSVRDDFAGDYVVKSIGAFGRWQCMVCLIAGLSRLLASYNINSILFLTPNVNFSCVKFKDNITMEAKNLTCYEDCIEYEYYQDVFEESLISEFDLICERKWLASFTQTVLMFGLVLGVSLFGWISDRFGRSKSMMICGIMDLIFMFSAPFSPNYWTFTIIRFFVGLASGGIMSISTIYIMEVVGPQHKELAGTLGLMPDGVGQATLAIFAYYTPTWHILLLVYSGSCVLVMAALLFLPETPRWLVANGKADEAIDLMTKVSKCNKLNPANIKEIVIKSIEELKINKDETLSLNYLDLFKNRKLIIITVSSCTMWFLTGVCYYGINQYMSLFGTDIYIVVAVIGILQLPLSPLASVILKKYGRKLSTIGSFAAIGVSMIVLVFLPEGSWISSLLGIIGVSAAGLVFCVIYIFVIELYPTPMRNMGFAVSSSGSKIGAMLAPFLASIEPHWAASMIFGILPFIAVAICLLLPETKGQKLRDDLEE